MARYRQAVTSIFLGCSLLYAFQQQTADPDLQSPVRFSVGLVQVDAVVTDAKGALITDLQPSDFEVLQDGKRQAVTHCRFMRAEHQRGPAQPVLGRSLSAGEVHRTFAVVVDDLGESFGSFATMRRNLLKLVDSEVQPNDLWAFYRTSGGSGANEIFSSDSRQIRAAVEKMRYVSGYPLRATTGYFTLQVLLRNAIRQLSQLPGRKSLLLLHAGGLSLGGCNSFAFEITPPPEMIRPIADEANRASVAIYSIDTRGLMVAGAPGIADFTDASKGQADDSGVLRTLRRDGSTCNPNMFARMMSAFTGGFALFNGNDTYEYMREVVNDDSGYYLLGWDPGPDAFVKQNGQTPYHHLKIKVLRKGLKVRTRDGFLGMPGAASPFAPSTEPPLVQTLFSPFSSGDLDVDLTAGVQHNDELGTYIESLVHIAPRNLNFVDAGKGCYSLKLELLSTARPLEKEQGTMDGQTTDIDVCGETAKQVLQNGLAFTLKTKVPASGDYEMRVAARNVSAGPAAAPKFGSAREFVQVPDLRKTVAALSGITLREASVATPGSVSPPGNGTRFQASYRQALLGDPAYRRFKPGDTIVFRSFLLPVEGKGGDAPLSATVRIIYDGKPIHSESVAVNNSAVLGSYQLAVDAKPGFYALAVELGGTKEKPETQMIDFAVQ